MLEPTLDAIFGLELVDVDVVDLEHWNRGMSQRCWLQYSEEGQNIMMGKTSEVNEYVVRYANGPLLSINQDSNAIALAIFQSDFAKKKSITRSIMKGSPAIVVSGATEDRKGRVVLISPHPEDGEPWTKAHFRNLFRWAAGHEPAETLDEKMHVRDSKICARVLVEIAGTSKSEKVQSIAYRLWGSGGLKILNKEGRDTKPNTKHRRLVPAKNAVKHPPKNQRQNRLSFNNLLPFAQDGYSMLRTKSISLPYVECINGPILITAPHGLKLAGPRRSHKREKYTSEIVLLLAKNSKSI